ncbi:hypothetical protein KW798_02020 [Candidatus Parcubacteria bacterium]|nr:hypothetical protein [Candidatus Parcubacteria bacterium]
MKYSTQASVVIVVLLTVLVGLYIYLNPLTYNQNSSTNTTTTEVSKDNFMQSLQVPVIHTYEGGMHVYSGSIGVPRGCTLQSGGTVVGDQGDTRVLIGLKIQGTGGGDCAWSTDTIIQPFSVSVSGSKPAFQGVTLNDVGIHHTLKEE